MTTLKTITVEFSKDTYTLEVCEFSVGGVCYSMYINGNFDKNYRRLDKETKKFFGLI